MKTKDELLLKLLSSLVSAVGGSDRLRNELEQYYLAVRRMDKFNEVISKAPGLDNKAPISIEAAVKIVNMLMFDGHLGDDFNIRILGDNKSEERVFKLVKINPL